MPKDPRIEKPRAKYTPKQQAVVDLIREQNRERSRERSRFFSDDGFITFRGHPRIVPAGASWLAAFLYPLIVFMLYCGLVAGNLTRAVSLFVIATLYYLYLFGVAHFLRSLAVTIVAVIVFAILKSK
ncbi:MAG: hypothetical protein LBC18_12505 [Opitutaceae bacterium]|jgi:hypothetical protein|nr:hypothetical protein [Opitutaceae bacterium]